MGVQTVQCYNHDIDLIQPHYLPIMHSFLKIALPAESHKVWAQNHSHAKLIIARRDILSSNDMVQLYIR